MKNLEAAMKVASSSVFCFYLKTHFVHLNVVGPNFYEYHKLLDDIYKDVWDSFDAISEQIRTLDIFAPASLIVFNKYSVVEDMEKVTEAQAMMYELLLDNEAVVETLKEANAMATDHPGLQNFLQGRIEAHEKWGWMLRATVKSK
jgi:starvation-inducible DNA-binding protein